MSGVSMEIITEIMRKNIVKGKVNLKSESCLELMMADFYKKAILKDNSKRDSLEEYLIECFSLGNGQYFIEFIEQNENLLYRLYNASCGFYKLCDLDKIRLMDKFRKCTDFNQVVETNQILMLESIFYSFNYDNESILNYYNNYIDTKGKTMRQHKKCLNILVEYLNGVKNTQQYSINILEALKYYYPVKKFLQVYEPDLLMAEDIVLLFYIENFSLDEIVELTKQDLKYIITIFDEYLYLGSNVNQIDQEVIDFINNEVSDKIKIKLKLKEN